MLEYDSDDSSTIFNEAPYDIFFDHPHLGKIKVASLGEKLPFVTKYLGTVGSDKVAKFRVENNLNVSVVKQRNKNEVAKVPTLVSKPQSLPSSSRKPLHCVTEKLPANSSLIFNNMEDIIATDNQKIIDEEQSSAIDVVIMDQENLSVFKQKEHESSILNTVVKEKGVSLSTVPESPPSLLDGESRPSLSTRSEFVMELRNSFEEKVINGLQIGIQKKVKEKMVTKEALSAQEDISICNVVIHLMQENFGNEISKRYSLCEDIGAVLKEKFPTTYSTCKAVRTDIGLLPINNGRGHGGSSALGKRLSTNFYNTFLRPSISKNGDSISKEGDQPRKKFKKQHFYELNADKYCLSFVESEKDDFKTLLDKLPCASTHVEMLSLLEQLRPYIQSIFRSKEPCDVVLILRPFFEAGTKILNAWFVWITDSDSNLAIEAENRIATAISYAEQYITNKNTDMVEKLRVAKHYSLLKTGNLIDYYVSVVREFSLKARNKPHFLVFLSGIDKETEGLHTPFVYVTRKNVRGIGNFDEELCFAVKVSNLTIYKNLTLPEALKALIQLYFVLNINYPKDCDDGFNFVQRAILGFGSVDGSRNTKNVIKKSYRDFESFVGKTVIETKLKQGLESDVVDLYRK